MINLAPYIPVFLVNRLTGVSRPVRASVSLVNVSDIWSAVALIMQRSHAFHVLSSSALAPLSGNVERCPHIKTRSHCACHRALAAKTSLAVSVVRGTWHEDG